MNRTHLPSVLRFGVMLLVALALCGCLEPSAEVTKLGEAQRPVDALVYVKAKSGLCFGVGTTSRMDTGAKLSYTNQIVTVPCAAVWL